MVSLTEKTGELNLVQKQKDNKIDYHWITVEEKTVKDNPCLVKREYSLNVMELANWIKQNLNYIFVRGEANEGMLLYVYMNGYYKCISNEEFKGFIKSFIPYQLRKSREINEIFIELTTELRFVDYEELNANEDIINFEDGILNLRTGELLPHSPDILSTIQIPAKYKEIEESDMEAPVFEKYMLNLCDNDLEVYDLLMQCLGLCISNIYAYRTKKALFLVGDGDSGKSQIKKLAEFLVGKANISNIDLKKANDRFGASRLYQKRLSGCNDMSYQRIEDMSIFKQLTGGDTIDVEFKNKNAFSFLYKGFLWFNCNKLPLFGGDTGKWVYDRIMPIYCNNVIPVKKRDPYLFEKIVEEKNAILKAALLALGRLIENNYHFIEPACLKENRKKYEIENNTLLFFIKEYCEVTDKTMPSLRTRRKDFFDCYDSWIKSCNNGRGKLSRRECNILLKKQFEEEFVKSNGVVYLTQIVLKPEAKEELGVY